MNFIAEARRALSLAGAEAVLCGPSAAHLHRLLLEPPAEVDVLVPFTTRKPEIPGVFVRRTRAEGRRPPLLEPLPHTDIVDTVLDLCDYTDEGTCIHWLTEAVRRTLVTMPQIEEALGRRNRHRHRRLIREMAEDVAMGATSNLEVRYSRDVERAHGLPRSVRQFIVPETGHPADFAYPQIKLLIEVDGLAYHSGQAGERDLALDAEHAAAGYVTRRYRWGGVFGTPCETAYEVAGVLRSAGVEVSTTRCRRELVADSEERLQLRPR